MVPELQQADSVEITTLVDDYVNGFLPNLKGVRRPSLDTVWFPMKPGEPMLAEFGWSCLVKIRSRGHVFTLMFDTGVGKSALLHNARALKVQLKDIEALVLSHGHPDHTAACLEAVSAIGRDYLPLIMHPNALWRRALVSSSGKRIDYPFFLNEKDLRDLGGRFELNAKPTSLANESACVTGEIPRLTSFEKGMPPNTHYRVVGGELTHDPLILDDQGLVISLRDKGLVVISGCAHAGIINTVEYAKGISGIDNIHAILGGFHLTGSFYEPVIEDTVKTISMMHPKFVVPSHCTGMRALVKIANAMPEAFVENSVGSTFVF